MGVLGGVFVLKSGLRILIWAPEVPFSVPPKTPKMGHFGFFFGYFGGIENGTSGAQIKILKSLFNTNTPLKPPFSRFGNNFRPRKSDFWPFYWFWSFSHWNSHWSRKIFRTAEGKVVHQKQNLFWKSETKWNNLKPCKSWNSKFHQNKNHLSVPSILPFWGLEGENVLWQKTCPKVPVYDRGEGGDQKLFMQWQWR